MENQEALLAKQIVEHTGTSLFLTGKAGTGKTTFLHRLKAESPKRMVVLAPTGIAAINAGGVTIHSFFQLPFAPFVPDAHYAKESFKISKSKIKLIRSLDLIVIDEISMVRADLLDSVDALLCRLRGSSRPFGGVQLLMIGDLQQLAPVVKDEEWALLKAYYDTPFFFSSRALARTGYATIELHHVYRQSDPRFIHLLNLVRTGQVDSNALAELNKRYLPNFHPHDEEGYIRLVTHNHQAAQINEQELAQIASPAYTYEATVKGDFPESAYPTDGVLTLKKGAQIMFVKNDTEHQYFNGMLGTITSIDQRGFSVQPLNSSGKGGAEIRVSPVEWVNARYKLNDKTNEIEETTEGTFQQYPVRLAWAITIHKSQGLTFEHAIINAHYAFTHGQTYVALSRCKTLEGLVLSSPIPPEAIICDKNVAKYTQAFERTVINAQTVSDMERNFFQATLDDLFDFSKLRHETQRLSHHVESNLSRLYPRAVAMLHEQHDILDVQISDVAGKFRLQLARLIAAAPTEFATDATIADRLHKACDYFLTNLRPLLSETENLRLPSDNKEIQRQTQALQNDLLETLRLKCRLLEEVGRHGFHLGDYMRCRAVATITPPNASKTKADKTSKAKTTNKASNISSDIIHPHLYQALMDWRLAQAKAEGVPAYVVLQQKALLAIANHMPLTPEELKSIPYFGDLTFKKRGAEILALVHQFEADENA